MKKIIFSLAMLFVSMTAVNAQGYTDENHFWYIEGVTFDYDANGDVVEDSYNEYTPVNGELFEVQFVHNDGSNIASQLSVRINELDGDGEIVDYVEIGDVICLEGGVTVKDDSITMLCPKFKIVVHSDGSIFLLRISKDLTIEGGIAFLPVETGDVPYYDLWYYSLHEYVKNMKLGKLDAMNR